MSENENKSNIKEYGSERATKERKDKRRWWTPEEDKALLNAAIETGITKELAKKTGRSVATMYQRINTLRDYESRYGGQRKLPDDVKALLEQWNKREHKRGRRPSKKIVEAEKGAVANN